jgi:transposase
MATSSYVGIDVSKDRLAVAIMGEERVWQVDNTCQGIDELVRWMQELQPELIVVEATGGYQRAVVDALFHGGISVAMVNPARVRQFARASGLLAKTDKLDAQVLAVFGQRMQPKQYEGKSEAEKQLSALLVRRKQLEEMLKAEQNRLRTIAPSLRGSVERMIVMLKEEKKRLEEQIEQYLKEQKAWRSSVRSSAVLRVWAR